MSKVFPIQLASFDTRSNAKPLGGQKYVTHQGLSVIRNGIKGSSPGAIQTGKPGWFRASAPTGLGFEQVRDLVTAHNVATVCQEARCPNIGECWSAGTATLMLLGAICTRACRFCAVDTGNPRRVTDADEPAKVADIVKTLRLQYVVLTSVNRDDLSDGGAAHFAATVRAVKCLKPAPSVEALTPDFCGRTQDIDRVINSGVDVFAHNLETVERLTPSVRDSRADYRQSLNVLRHAKSQRTDLLVKTSVMLGLGETETELYRTLDDARTAGVDVITMGQYLRPSSLHLPVQRWVHPDTFEMYRAAALARGFTSCVAGPMVRSSYRAESILLSKKAEMDADRIDRQDAAPGCVTAC